MHKGYKCLDKQTGRIYISHDVIFDESRFPFAASFTCSIPSPISKGASFPQTEPILVNDHLRKYDLSFLLANHFDAAAAPVVPIMNIPRTNISFPMTQQQENSSSQQPENLSSTPTVQTAEPASAVTEDTTVGITVTSDGSTVVTNTDSGTSASSPSPASSSSPPLGVTTCAQAGKSFPRQFTDGTILYNSNRRVFFAEPTSHHLALSDLKWRLAMEAEFDAL